MIKKSAYRPVGFRVPQNYVDKIEPKGVDFSSPQMEANKDRGVYSINYRYNGKKGEKRWGYQKVGYVPEGTEHNPIFGMWSFVGGVTNTKRTIAIAGKNFYEATYDGRWHFTKVGELDETPVGIAKESAVVVGNYLYLLAGGKMYCFTENENEGISIKEISDLNAYVPTTTTLITPLNAEEAPSVGPAHYEAPNLLSDYRKNTFVGGVTVSVSVPDTNPYFAEYLLDGDVYKGYYGAVSIELSLETSGIYLGKNKIGWPFSIGNGTTQWSNPSYKKITAKGRVWSNDFSKYSADSDSDIRAVEEFIVNREGRILLLDQGDDPESHWTSYVDADHGNHTAAIKKSSQWYYIGNIYGSDVTTATLTRIIGYVDVLEDGSAKLCMLNNYAPSSNEDNIILQYRTAGDGGESKAKVLNCRYFAKFGHNNKLNTVWAYGNPDKPNYVWNSRRPEQKYEIDNEVHDADEDFTYWPSDGYRKLGEPNSAIVGMEVVSETKMMALKTKGGSSPTMYFISPIIVTKDMDGNSETTTDSYTIAEYSTFQSNTSTAGIVPTPDGICNLNGDILFFSNEKQVAGLDIEGITGDSRRAANTRSAYIDRELAKLDPASVKLFTFGNYLILDSNTQTYCCHLSQYSADTRQYEWWAIDNINATFFYEDDDGNAFYTDDKGGIYLLANSTIDETGRSKKVDIDRYFINADTGDVGVYSTTSAHFYVPNEIRDAVCGEEGWKFKVEGPAYGRLGLVTDLTRRETHLILKDEHLNLAPYFQADKIIVGLQEANSHYSYVPESGTDVRFDVNITARSDAPRICKFLGLFAMSNLGDDSHNYSIYGRKFGESEEFEIADQHEQVGLSDNYDYFSVELQAGETLEYIRFSNSTDEFLFYELSVVITDEWFGVFKVVDHDNESTAGREFDLQKISGDDLNNLMQLYAPLDGEYEIEAGSGYGSFKLATTDFDQYLIRGGNSVSGEFSKETPIQSMWISRPVPLAKFSYDKTIKQVDVYNDTQEPAELYIGCITNKQLHTYQYARIEAFDLGNIDFENTTFTQKRVPVIYHMKRFPRKHQYFSLVQMSTGTDNSLLSDMDITYTLQGVARNKK